MPLCIQEMINQYDQQNIYKCWNSKTALLKKITNLCLAYGYNHVLEGSQHKLYSFIYHNYVPIENTITWSCKTCSILFTLSETGKDTAHGSRLLGCRVYLCHQWFYCERQDFSFEVSNGMKKIIMDIELY